MKIPMLVQSNKRHRFYEVRVTFNWSNFWINILVLAFESWTLKFDFNRYTDRKHKLNFDWVLRHISICLYLILIWSSMKKPPLNFMRDLNQSPITYLADECQNVVKLSVLLNVTFLKKILSPFMTYLLMITLSLWVVIIYLFSELHASQIFVFLISYL